VLTLLTAQAIDTFWQGFFYMALFGLGSIIGMAVLSCAISLPLRYAARHLTWGYNGLSAVMGLFTVGLGLQEGGVRAEDLRLAAGHPIMLAAQRGAVALSV
jgi:sulfite exporter TauE/SafE